MSNNLISGERLMKIADLCIVEKNCLPNLLNGISKYIEVGYGGQDPNMSIPLNTELIQKKNIDKFKNSKIIFVKTDFITIFFDIYYQYLENNLIIITHNSDYPIDELKRKYIDLPKIKLWFGMNTLIQHPKLITIPIGIANSQYKHGNIDLLESIKNDKSFKNNLLMVNFNTVTNKNKRINILNLMKKKGFQVNDSSINPVNQKEYLKKLSSSKFCIAPPGNGFDCHRIWECIFLDVIPIIEKNDAFKQFSDLPILEVDDWNVLNKEYLNNIYSTFSKKNKNKSLFDFWIKTINSTQIIR